MKSFRPYIILVINFLCIVCLAQQETRPIATTNQIKEINYNPNKIHKYTGFFGYQSSIVFEEGETIATISMGDSSGWQITHQGNRIFLKPIEDNPETNATILTNKRVYHFVLYGKEAKNLDDPELSYEVRFKYPSNGFDVSGIIEPDKGEKSALKIESKPYFNFNYKISGKDEIKPLKIFDDGQFTYIQFKDINADLPAVFLVDSEGYEALINYHISGPYMVIERVSARFTLRHGSDHVCVFNENMKYTKKKVKRRGVFG